MRLNRYIEILLSRHTTLTLFYPRSFGFCEWDEDAFIAVVGLEEREIIWDLRFSRRRRCQCWSTR
jgi:hypothetical protein